LLLFSFDDRVDDAIEKGLRPSVPKMQCSMPAEAVVDGKSDPDEGDIQAPGQVVSLAISNEKIRLE
jgi:hypothetical protein